MRTHKPTRATLTMAKKTKASRPAGAVQDRRSGADSGFSRSVLRWYAVHGRHDLPWQQNRDPYRIWVSEIMLQQTQVATVIPYYRRFLSRFPSIQALAQARIDSVLSQWTGLGYYARARNLHEAARIIQKHFGGVFPDQLEDVMSLPGIGRSTAGAILSFSKHQSHPILDGNVRRVLARCFAVPHEVTSSEGQKALWDLTERLLPSRGVAAAAFNQAMMDLGATLCTRRSPDCVRCPLKSRCQGLALGKPEQFPIVKSRRSRPIRSVQLLVLKDPRGRVLLCRRPAKGIWGGLWGFPESDLRHDPAEACWDFFRVRAQVRENLPAIEHGFSHFVLRMTPQKLTVSAPAAAKIEQEGRRWVNPGAVGRLGLAAPIKLLLDQLDKDLNDK